MDSNDLKKRTKKFCIDCLNLSKKIPAGEPGWTISSQFVRSSSSTASNYRAVCRAKSDKDFISKLKTVIEESDETEFWLEIIKEINLIESEDKQIEYLKKEAHELTAIFVSSVRTVKKRINIIN